MNLSNLYYLLVIDKDCAYREKALFFLDDFCLLTSQASGASLSSFSDKEAPLSSYLRKYTEGKNLIFCDRWWAIKFAIFS